MNLIRFIAMLMLFSKGLFLFAQDSIVTSNLQSLTSNYYEKLSQKISGFEVRLDRKTEQYLAKLSREEEKIYKKLWKKDSSKAKELFGDIKSQYKDLQTRAREKAGKLASFSKMYSGKLDSLSTAYKFLGKTGMVNPALQDKLKASAGAINQLQAKLDQTDQIKQYLRERKKMLTDQLEKLGMLKQLRKFNKEVFYYQQQLAEYKALLNDPAKLEEKLFGLLTKLPAFKEFFANNSQLAQLFRLPGSNTPSMGNGQGAGLAGLQTRASVMQQLQTRFGSGPQTQQAVQRNLQSAQSKLNDFGSRINRNLPSGSTSDEELPNFKPNNQRTKGFLQRLEFGVNFQNQRSNSLLPVTSDLGLSLGYKLNDKSLIGIGASYKLGWGSNIQHIHITHQGVSFRSFLDWKVKGSFLLSGGYEMNYRSEFNRIRQLHDYDNWQVSGLIGVSKIVAMNSKVINKTKIQLLWDFMSYRQVPVTQSFIFRINYSIK